MIVGEHTRGNDLEVNVLKGKKLTNIRTHSKDEAVRLIPPIQMTLEKALAYINDEELVEVTPKAIRLRKKLLDPNDRKKAERVKEAEAGVVNHGPGLLVIVSTSGLLFLCRRASIAFCRATMCGALLPVSRGRVQ